MSIPYPMPSYHFMVEWGGSRTGFKEVSGLNIIHEVVEYREGGSPVDSSIKMPGRTRYDNIILKRGIVKGDNNFFEWMKTKQNSQIERRDLSIRLLDEKHSPIMVWKVKGAFPVKLIGPELSADGNEVAIESIELAHEGIKISKQ